MSEIKLKWKMISDTMYTCHIGIHAFDLQVSQNQNGANRGKWSVVIGMRYYSRDSGNYYETPDIGMKKAESLLRRTCEFTLGQLGSEVYEKKAIGVGVGEGDKSGGT